MIFISQSDILDGKAVLLIISGQLDSSSSPDFEDYINETISRNIRFIIFDAKNLEFVTSEGIGVLILVQKKIVNINGFFVIINLSDEIRTLFTLLGFDNIFTFIKTRIEAMQLIDRQIELRENNSEISSEEIPSVEIKQEKIPEQKSAESGSIVFSSPVIIECVKCKSLIRIKEPGDYLCSDCSGKFSINEEQIVSFK
jgi:anti-sigma B factor antagonist/stage II sporulation protein AA (anti-sigma F factor antagonist)